MARDKAVLADHHRQVHPGILRDRESLNVVVIGLLIVLRIDLDPAGVPCAHSVGVVTVDINRAGQCAVDQREHDGQSVGRRKEQFLPHQRKPRGRSRCHRPRARRLSTDRRGHRRVLALHRNEFRVDLSVCNISGHHLRDLRGRCDGKSRHHIRIHLADRVGDGLIS